MLIRATQLAASQDVFVLLISMRSADQDFLEVLQKIIDPKLFPRTQLRKSHQQISTSIISTSTGVSHPLIHSSHQKLHAYRFTDVCVGVHAEAQIFRVRLIKR